MVLQRQETARRENDSKNDKTRCLWKEQTEEESTRKRGRQGLRNPAGATRLLALHFSLELCFVLCSAAWMSLGGHHAGLHLLRLLKHLLRLLKHLLRLLKHLLCLLKHLLRLLKHLLCLLKHLLRLLKHLLSLPFKASSPVTFQPLEYDILQAPGSPSAR